MWKSHAAYEDADNLNSTHPLLSHGPKSDAVEHGKETSTPRSRTYDMRHPKQQGRSRSLHKADRGDMKPKSPKKKPITYSIIRV